MSLVKNNILYLLFISRGGTDNSETVLTFDNVDKVPKKILLKLRNIFVIEELKEILKLLKSKTNSWY